MSKQIFNRETLLLKLKKIVTVIPKKAVITAHETFLFNVVSGVLSVTATDSEKQITTWCNTVKSEGDTKFTIPAKLLVRTLDLMIDPEVTFTKKAPKEMCAPGECIIEIKCGKSKYKMQSDDGSAYPIMDHIKSKYEASFSGALFNQTIETASKYTNAESGVPAQQGICFRLSEDNRINVYGFSGFEICKIVVTPRSINNWGDILIPVSTIKCINKCINDGDIVDVIHNKDKVEIKTDEVSVIAVAFNVKYPDTEVFFKKRPQTNVKFNTFQFLTALQRLDLYAKEEEPKMIVNIKTANVELQVQNEQYNRDGIEEIDIVAELECRYGVNVKFLINALTAFTNDEFNMYYSAPDKPVFIEPVNVMKDNDKFFMMSLMTIN